MNERIRELAKQAGITTNLDTDYYEKDMNRWVDYFSEKFAELIVTECISVVDDMADPEDSDRYFWAIQNVSQKIKQHFGVER